jgi:S1-C subfamily serine protease
MERQQTYSRQANRISRRGLLKTGLTAGAVLSAWPLHRPLGLRGTEAGDTHLIGGNTGWEIACERMMNSIHAVISESVFEGIPRWRTLGTAFLISLNPYPILITNAHVVADKTRNLRQGLALTVFGYPSAAVAGLRVQVFAPELDLAVLRASPEAAIGKVVTFSNKVPLPRGAAIASLGFPIPETPKFTESRGNLRINLRLAAGFISANEFSGFVAQDYDWPPHDLLHYELYMLSYRGISGGPLFNIDGQVVGLIRGGQEAYTYALRNSEVLQLLESNGVTYQKA